VAEFIVRPPVSTSFWDLGAMNSLPRCGLCRPLCTRKRSRRRNTAGTSSIREPWLDRGPSALPDCRQAEKSRPPGSIPPNSEVFFNIGILASYGERQKSDFAKKDRISLLPSPARRVRGHGLVHSLPRRLGPRARPLCA
jgi:hypothetical protein